MGRRLASAMLLFGFLMMGAWLLEKRLRPLDPKVLAVFLFTVVLWASVWLPPHITVALSLVALWALGTASVHAVLAGFLHPVILIVLGTFIYGEAVRKTGLGRRLALHILSWSRGDSRVLVLTTFGVVLLFTVLVPSNVGRIAMIVPVVRSVADVFRGETRENLLKILMIGVTFASTTASTAVMTGAGSTLYVVGTLSRLSAGPISYIRWLVWFAPPIVLFLFGLWQVFVRMFPLPDRVVPGGREHLDRALRELGTMAPAEKRTLALFVAMLMGWITEAVHGLSMEVIALTGAAVLVVPGIGALSPREGWETMRWDIFVLFAGSMSLAQILVETGLVAHLATWLFHPLPSRPVLLLAITLLPILIVVRLGFANVIGMLATVLPVVLSAASQWGMDPLWLGLLTYPVMAPGLLLPTQSPASMVSFGFATYTAQEYRRAGIAATLLLSTCFLLAAFLYWPVLGVTWLG